jgi:hypothetical protein
MGCASRCTHATFDAGSLLTWVQLSCQVIERELLLVDLVERFFALRSHGQAHRCETGPCAHRTLKCTHCFSVASPRIVWITFDLALFLEPLAPDAAEHEETEERHLVIPFTVLARRESHPTDQLVS